MPEGSEIPPTEPTQGPPTETTQAQASGVGESSSLSTESPSGPPIEVSSTEREIRFEPVHKVRSRPSVVPGQDNEVPSEGEVPFAHVDDADAPVMEPSQWDRLSGHPRFRQIAAAALVGAVLVAGALAWSVRSGTGAPQRTAEQFLDYLDVGDYPRAQAMFDPVCSNGVTERTLAGIFNDFDFVHELTDTEIAGSGAVVTGTVEVAGVGEVPVRVNLRRLDGDWRLCGIGTR